MPPPSSGRRSTRRRTATSRSEILKPAYELDPDYRTRFLREARAAGALQHPNIVQLFDVTDEAGAPAIIMELVDGPSLAELVERQGALAPAEARRLLLQLAGGVGFAHARGRVHRDLKPSNILLDRDLRTAKVADFGIAQITQDAAQLTQVGQLVGTPRYMAPEQLEGGRVDARADLFALGAVAYEMLSGAKAFDGGSLATLSHQICNLEPRSLRERVPGVPADLAEAVARLLRKKPEDRFPSADAFAAAISGEGEAVPPKAALGRRPSAAASGERPAPDAPGRSRRLWPLAGAGAAALVVAAVVAALYLAPLAPPPAPVSAPPPAPATPPSPQAPAPQAEAPSAPSQTDQAANEPAPDLGSSSPPAQSQPPEPAPGPQAALPPEPEPMPPPRAPVPEPPPPSTYEPPLVPPPQPADWEPAWRQTVQAVAKLPCARLEVASLDGRPSLLGLGPATEQPSLQDLATSLPRSPALDLADVSPGSTQCSLLDLLAGHTTPNPVSLVRLASPNQDRRVAAADGMTLLVNRPDQPSWITVDYLMADGGTYHLVDIKGASARPEPAGGTFILRLPELSPPFGREMIVVTASPARLFDKPRPQSEPTPAYLDALGRALRAARGPRTPLASVLPIETVDRLP